MSALEQKSQKFAFYVILASLLSHIFCCGLPFLASLLSIGGSFFAGLSNAGIFEFFESYEVPILIFSASTLVLTGVFLIVSQKINCNEDVCEHKPCSTRKSSNLKLYLVAVGLFIINIVSFLLLG